MNNDNQVTQNIELINDIKFTPKEIDVISCIVGNSVYKKNKERPEKSIESLIYINLNTLNTHLRNIKLKIKCSRQEEIVEFVESSKQYEFIINKYIEIRIKYEFDKVLKNINIKNSANEYECECEIHVCACNNKYETFVESLKKAGINIKLSFENNIPDNFTPNCFHVIYTEKNNNDISSNNPDILFVVDYNNKLSNINEGKQFDFYSGTLECINKICKNKQITKIINDFEIFCAKLNSKYSYNNLPKPIKKLFNYKQYLFLFASFFIGLCLIVTWINFNKSNEITNNRVLDSKQLLARSNLITEISNVFSKQNNKKFAILVGAGGSGKTTLARLYLQMQASEIQWEINAETKDSTLKSFFDLANILANSEKLKNDLLYIKANQNHEEKLKQLIEFVFSRLKREKNWILLFDNVENFKIIKEFLPNSGINCGSIIITTRNSTLGDMAYFPKDCSIKIKDLDKNEQTKLFCNILYGSEKRLDSEKLKEVDLFLEHIPPMPLDVSAAAYYLKNTNETFDGYLNLTKQTDREFEKLHGKLVFENMDYSATRYGIITSTLKQISDNNPEFKELLLFVCMGDSQNIPKNLRGLKSTIVVNDFLHHLRKHSLIVDSKDSFSIHRSTKKIGLDYMMSILSEDEKIKYLDRIVNVMKICTNSILNPSRIDLVSTLPHLEFIVQNIKKLNFPNKIKYEVKILTLMFSPFDVTKPFCESNDLAEKILKLNAKNNYIDERDVADILIALAFNYLFLGKFDRAEECLNKCFAICNKLNISDLKVRCFMAYGWLYSEYNDIQKSISSLKTAIAMLKTIDKKSAKHIIIPLSERYCNCFIHNYINKKQLNHVVAFLLENLEFLGISDFFYKRKNYDNELPKGVATIREALSCTYNMIGEYQKALECELEVRFVYEKRREKGITSFFEANLDVDYGYTMLRINNLKEALKSLTNAITYKLNIEDTHYLLEALVYRSEARIRLAKFEKAYEDCKKALDLSKNSKSKHNLSKLLNVICHYNLAIAKYKLHDTNKSLEHFKDFFQKAENFCHGFLDSEKLKHINEIKVFEIHKDIKIYLKNSLEIFKAIYGENHAFIKDYVRKN